MASCRRRSSVEALKMNDVLLFIIRICGAGIVDCTDSLRSIIVNVCKKYKASRFYLSPDIPAKKLSNFTKAVSVHPEASALVLIDTTFFGSSLYGMLITEYGLYIHNAYPKPTAFFIDWVGLGLTVNTEYPKLKSKNSTDIALTPTAFFR